MNLLKYQRPMFISTFNVRTLNEQARQGEITVMSGKYQINVTCNQEHRIHHPEEKVKHHDLGNVWIIIASSAEKAIRGVGMFVSPIWKYIEVSSMLNGKSKNYGINF